MIGKSYLSAIFCVCRCILYPGTKICIASGTRGQSLNVFDKINLELKTKSPELAAEIDEKESKSNNTNAQIVFKNGSYIKVVTAGDSARGNRANILLLDEARMIRKDIIDTILRKFLTQRRMPDYNELTEAQKKAEYDKEKNMTLYLTSAYWSDSWIYTKCQDTFRAMMDDTKRQFVCGLPYQLSIAEGLLDRDTVADEMADSDFSEVKFSINILCWLNLSKRYPTACADNICCRRKWRLNISANRGTLNRQCTIYIVCMAILCLFHKYKRRDNNNGI